MKEVHMYYSSSLRYGTIVPFILGLFFVFGGCGGRNSVAPSGNGQESFACANQTVGIVPVAGTSPKDIYVCTGSTLTWIPNGHNFTVTFPQQYPFQGSPKTFTNDRQKPNDPVTSPPAIYSGSLIVYHYTMTIDGAAVADPQVVGGGSHSY